MNSIVLACPTVEKELMQSVKQTGFTGEICFLPKYLHNDPNKMRQYLQEKIDRLQQIDEVLLCVSGCGGSTIGLKATSAKLVIPRCRDCVDLLLSTGENCEIKRQERGIFLTEGWMNLMKNSAMSLERMTQNLGREKAEQTLRKIYTGFHSFYLIETGTYDTQPVRDYILPLVQTVGGTIESTVGEYSLIKKLLSREWEEHFLIVPKGESVTTENFCQK